MNTKESRLNSQKIQFDNLTTKGWEQTIYKGLNIFTHEESGKFQLCVFWDTSAKNINKYYYRDEKRRSEVIENYKSNYDRQKAYKAESKANPLRSTSANCAAAIRAELKKEFPLTKFSVTSSNFSGGNSVRIEWTDGPMSDQVESFTDRYQSGHFNSMEDIYEYSNNIEGLPQSKFVSTSRKQSEEFKALLPVLVEMMGDYETDWRNSHENILYRIFAKTSITGKITGLEKRKDINCGSIEDFYKITFEGEAVKPVQEIVKQVATAGEIQIVDYSEKAFAVIGDTKNIKDQLKALGGKFNFRLTCGAGWIFSKKQLETVTKALSEGQEETHLYGNEVFLSEFSPLVKMEYQHETSNTLEQYPDTLKGEIDKTLDMFAEMDIKNNGAISESTKECFKVQGRDIDEVKIYDNLKDINQAVKDGQIISLCNLSDIVNNRQAK